MLVTITNTASITIDLECSVKWNSTIKREFSSASFFVPRNSPAFSSAYMDENGGFLVKIVHPKLGTWLGIAGVPTIDVKGANVEATEIGILATIRTVGTHRIFTGVTAGTIVAAAVQDATAGLSHAFLKAGTFLEAGPHVPQYEFTGQYLSQVLADMMDITGQEWEINYSTGAINWVAPRTTMYQYHLTDDGDIVNASKSGSLNDVVAEVTARGSDGSSRSEYSPGQGFYLRQETIAVDTKSPIDLAFQAKAVIDQRKTPVQTYKGMLKEYREGGTTVDHWSNIREGDIVQLVLPYAGITGNSPVVRVLSREFKDGDKYLQLEFQYPAYADRTNAARILNKGVVVREAPTPAELSATDPCLSEAVNSRTTTISSISTAAVTDINGITSATATVNITPVVNACHEFYYVRYRKSGETIYAYIPTYSTTLALPGLISGQTYQIGVATVGKSGKISAYSTDTNSAQANDAVAPDAPTNLAVSTGYQSLFLTWTGSAAKDLSHYRIQGSYDYNVLNPGVATWSTIATTKSTWFKDQISPSITSTISRWYRIYAVDLSGNESVASLVSGGTTTVVITGIGTGAVGDNHIGSVGPAKFTTGTFTTSITVGAGGRLNFGTGDYLANNILHFEVTNADNSQGKIEFKNSNLTPYGILNGYIDSFQSNIYLKALYLISRYGVLSANGNSSFAAAGLQAAYDANHNSYVQAQAFANTGSIALTMNSLISGLIKTHQISMNASDSQGSSNINIAIEGNNLQTFQNGLVTFPYNNGGGTLPSVSIVGRIRYWQIGQTGYPGNSGFMAAAPRYLPIYDGAGTLYFVPAYNGYNSGGVWY